MDKNRWPVWEHGKWASIFSFDTAKGWWVSHRHMHFIYLCLCLCLCARDMHGQLCPSFLKAQEQSILFLKLKEINPLLRHSPLSPSSWLMSWWVASPSCLWGSCLQDYSCSFYCGQQFLLLSRGPLQPCSNLSTPSVPVIYLGNKTSVRRHCSDFNTKVPLQHFAAFLALFYKPLFFHPMLSEKHGNRKEKSSRFWKAFAQDRTYLHSVIF